MKKLLWTLAAFTFIISPSFANLEWTAQWDIMFTTTNIEEKIEFYKDWKEPTIYKSLEELLKNEKNVTTITDGCNNGFVMWTGAALTMMYCEEIYGENGNKKWQRTDTKVTIYWDDANYFDKNIFIKLDKNTKLKSEVVTKLKSVDKEKLEKASEKILTMIEKVKLSRIAKKWQDIKITQLYFIKFSIQEVLTTK